MTWKSNETSPRRCPNRAGVTEPIKIKEKSYLLEVRYNE